MRNRIRPCRRAETEIEAPLRLRSGALPQMGCGVSSPKALVLHLRSGAQLPQMGCGVSSPKALVLHVASALGGGAAEPREKELSDSVPRAHLP